uniref:Retrovirus-related Pol polyprotein from transposon TNT 1-94 n=1 Tax=Cajanus cajan TaxID=3821 RepID=A0A151RAD5_CAJCA|nr:Retrovirus-related Pol polyprotein from transposon TNT 1-94 [Cajanus cajan]
MVEIFDGSGHFGMWQSEVLDALFQQGLDITIEGKKPESMGEEDWKTLNRLACGTIRSCLSREQKYAFCKETSASKLMTELEEKFLKKSSQNKLHMKKRLFRFTYIPGATMNDHITSFNQLVADLLNLDVTFEDEDLALMLLGSLPEEFEFLETTLLHGKVAVSLNEVCGALYSYELRRKDKKDSSEKANEALVARGRPVIQAKGKKKRSKSKAKVGKDECAFCREKGHWKKDCPKLKNKGQSKTVADSNVAEYVDDSDCSLAVSGSTSSSSAWLLDSGCSNHMCPNREWFYDFRELEEGVVYTANDVPLTTHGIGSIRLKNRDGAIRTLKDVRFVPSLSRNLISVGALSD